MSTINPHYAPPAGAGQNTNVMPGHSTPTAGRPNPPPSSGPNWSTPPQTPYQPPKTHASAANNASGAKPSAPNQSPQEQADKGLKELNALLPSENIEELVSNPDSDQSRAILAKLRPLMNQANISSYLRGPNAEENAKTLEDIGKRLDKGKLDASQNSCLKGLGDKYMQNAKLKNLEMLIRAFDGGLEDFAGFISNSNEGLNNLRKQMSGTTAATKELSDFGGQLSKGNIDTLRRGGPNRQR